MYNTMIGNELLYTTVTTEVTIGGTDSSSSGSGENLLESPESNTKTETSDVSQDTTLAEGETTNADVNAESDVAETDTSNIEGETTTTDNADTTDAVLEGDTDSSDVDASINEGEVIDASGDTGDMSIEGDMSVEGDMSIGGDMTGVDGMEGMNGETTGSTTKDPFLSSYVPIVGISAATLVVGAIIGILLAKKKIKKGIDLYED